MTEQKQYLKEITQTLQTGITQLFESDGYRKWLDTMGRFHEYSLNNTLLIYAQRPDSTLVAGYNMWKSAFGRQVKKGEKAIKIIAPAPYKKKVNISDADKQAAVKEPESGDGQTEIIIPAFKVVNVFDVSQTEGRELPSLGADELTGNAEGYQKMWSAFTAACPVPVSFEDIRDGAKGYYHAGEKRIAIRTGMSELQNLKTLIHEMAHQKLHSSDGDKPDEKLTRNAKEVEAESVAYTVCRYYGFDTSDYSFAYVAGWSEGKELPELKASLERIRNAAAELIDDADRQMQHEQKEQGEPASEKKKMTRRKSREEER